MPVSQIIIAIDVFKDGKPGVATYAPRAFPCVVPIQLNRTRMTKVAQTNYSKISQIPGLGKIPVQLVDAMVGMGTDLSARNLREPYQSRPCKLIQFLQEDSHTAPNFQEGPCLPGQGLN